MVDAPSLVIPRFHDVLGDVAVHGHTHYWLYGGRGSTKSSFISLCIVLLALMHPEANAVVIRRFSNTLRDSVFSQMTWAIAALGLDAWLRARISPMELTYLPTGQRIVFRGADDPLKLEGVKFSRGYAAVIWFEELERERREARSCGSQAIWTWWRRIPIGWARPSSRRRSTFARWTSGRGGPSTWAR